jgi:hypothetical protein
VVAKSTDESQTANNILGLLRVQFSETSNTHPNDNLSYTKQILIRRQEVKEVIPFPVFEYFSYMKLLKVEQK